MNLYALFVLWRWNKREKICIRLNRVKAFEHNTRFSLLDELRIHSRKGKQNGVTKPKDFFNGIYHLGSKKSLEIFKTLEIPAPSIKTLQRHGKKLLQFTEFGIFPPAFDFAKEYYRSISYSGSFIV